jgi:serine/threonine protein kinase
MIGIQIGDLRLVRQLDKGGMGDVYLAEHLLLNDLRAVKLLDPALAHNEEFVTRFLNEGRAGMVRPRGQNSIDEGEQVRGRSTARGRTARTAR